MGTRWDLSLHGAFPAPLVAGREFRLLTPNFRLCSEPRWSLGGGPWRRVLRTAGGLVGEVVAELVRCRVLRTAGLCFGGVVVWLKRPWPGYERGGARGRWLTRLAT